MKNNKILSIISLILSIVAVFASVFGLLYVVSATSACIEEKYNSGCRGGKNNY